jgi:hypothetical protein
MHANHSLAHDGWSRPYRRVAWALALILVGVFALLGNLGIFHVEDWSDYWPVALIAIGVFQLVDRVGAAVVAFRRRAVE